MSRHMNSGRFAYAMGFKSRSAAQDAFDAMCCEGEMFPSEGKIEPYNISGTPHKQLTRWAITTE